MREQPKVWCIGDSILDISVYSDRFRRTQEDPLIPVFPTPSPLAPAMCGGAANLAANLVAMGCKTYFHSEIGSDYPGRQLITKLTELDVETGPVISGHRQTTVKTRYYESGKLIGRHDNDYITPIPIYPPEGDKSSVLPKAVVMSDYGKGVITKDSAAAWLKWAHDYDVPVFIDPKLERTGMWASLSRGNTTMVANWVEARELSGELTRCADSDQNAERIAAIIGRSFTSTVVKRGAHGSTWYSAGKVGHTPPIHPQSVFDVQGAGDTYLAGLVAASCRGLNLPDACLYASAAAGIAVGRPGTAIVTSDEISAALAPHAAKSIGTTNIEDAEALAIRLKAMGFRVGLAGGCFDILHPGHIAVITEAAQNCDFLFVAVDSDERVRKLKGADRPTNSENDRIQAIAALRGVGATFVFRTDPELVVRALKPDIFAKGGDRQVDTVLEAACLQEWGGRLLTTKKVETLSTTQRIQLIKERTQC
jgi:D-beta-D-heptose 7-phosphate kinase/D-beta-D-heptose 1-phosphate adenosyltransferase